MDAFLGFSGRIGRGKWWLVQLVNMAITTAAMLWSDAGLAAMLLGQPDNGNTLPVLLTVFTAAIIFNICSTVQRYHDRGKSGFWYFISFIPLIGGIWQFIECGFCSGDDGENAYGSAPGVVRSQGRVEREVAELSASRLAQIDDDYFKKYSSRLVQEEKAIIAAATAPTAPSGPVFGKRVF